MKEEIIKEANRIFNANILAKIKQRKYVYGRMAYVRLMKKRGCAYTEIGKHLGMHYSSIIYMDRVFDDIIKQDDEFKRNYRELHNLFIKKRRRDKIERMSHTIKSLELQIKELKLQLMREKKFRV